MKNTRYTVKEKAMAVSAILIRDIFWFLSWTVFLPVTIVLAYNNAQRNGSEFGFSTMAKLFNIDWEKGLSAHKLIIDILRDRINPDNLLEKTEEIVDEIDKDIDEL